VVCPAGQLHVDALGLLHIRFKAFSYNGPVVGQCGCDKSGRLGALDMAWLTLMVAGLFEVGWAIGLKYTHGFTRLWPTVATVTCMALSFVLLAHALKTLPIGTAYAVWTGIGTVGTALMGIILFAEPLETVRLGCVLLIVIGITGLRLLG
jgi:quaternary ammonium compound-resistance protein SugE